MITGVVTGASRGIGHEVVKKLLNANCKVYALARNHQALNKLVSYARNKRCVENLKTLAIDITIDDNILKLTQSLEQNGDQVNFIINNAGLLINKSVSEITKEDFQSVYTTNVWAPFNIIKNLLPLIKSEPFAHIVNISSVGGLTGSLKFPGLSMYSSSKGALNILGECLNQELQDKNIAVNNLCLGAVQTEMLSEAFPDYKAPLSAEQMAEYITNFTVSNHQYIRGKSVAISRSDP